jgi:hypothetical protein
MNKPYPQQSRFNAAGVATALILMVSVLMGLSVLIDPARSDAGAQSAAPVAQTSPNHG